MVSLMKTGCRLATELKSSLGSFYLEIMELDCEWLEVVVLALS